MMRFFRSRRLLGALAGLLAGVVALAVGELVAGILPDAGSPIVSVGNVVIDNVPGPVKDFAIATFGTGDKVALIVGILVVLAIVAGAIGIVALRSLRLGLAGIALFGAVGGLAAAQDDQAGLLATLAPSIVGALAGMATLAAVVPTVSLEGSSASPRRAPDTADRRQFLLRAGVIGASAVAVGAVGRFLTRSASAAASRAQVVLAAASRPLAPVAADVVAAGAVPFFTPNDDFYRIDTALIVPAVEAETWSLRVHGMVDNELTFTFDELVARDLVEADITLTCVSNEVGGTLVGTARWLGVRLDAILREAGVQDGADQVVGRSVDGFACGFPVEAAMDGRDALIAVGMNGEPLPLEHGFPARLVVPGLYGYVSATKWLEEIELTTFEAFDHYWVNRGWAVEGPIKTQSRIDVPKGLARVAAGPTAVAGVAWAQHRGIESVEVQVDDGEWAEARLAGEAGIDTWRQWTFDWDATPGSHTLRVRATDATGETQTDERVPPIPDGATGWHSIRVSVDEAPAG